MTEDEGIDLFELGQMYFKAFAAEFAAYGIPPNPRMELRPGKGMLCYYDLNDGHIYLSVPDLNSPMGRLQVTVMASLLSCDTDEELLRLLRIFIPRIVAHEMGHHLRHLHGVFGTNMWHEEQIANQIAVAVTKHRMSPDEKRFARETLKRAMDGLASQYGGSGGADPATVTYYNVLHALNASGKLPDSALERIEVAQRLFEMRPEDFEDSVELTASQTRSFLQRDSMIGQINAEYAQDFLKYMYYHAGWLYLDLTGHGAEYVDEFARLHLNIATPILPPIENRPDPTAREIYACYCAYLDVAPASQAAARFFYKRYRRLLWTKMQTLELPLPVQTERLKTESTFFLESWDEGESDALGYLAHLAPADIRALFPNRIGSYSDPGLLIQTHLPTETDRRLWQHIALHESDLAAAHTLYRLTLLDHTDVFRPMPAESMLELVASLCRVKLAPGETIIWEGDINDDVFFLLQGRLEVLVLQNSAEKRVGTVYPGEVFGEMAFFSRDTRNATVRATMPSECFVIKDSALLSLVFKHPSILMQMAGALAKRLARLNQRAALTDMKVDSVRG
jgi:CRP/FNR family transcriptional regulator, cyclic AMP receptor protein